MYCFDVYTAMQGARVCAAETGETVVDWLLAKKRTCIVATWSYANSDRRT